MSADLKKGWQISNNFIILSSSFTITVLSTCQLIWKKGGKFQIFLAPILDGEIDDAIFDLKSWRFATCKVWWNRFSPKWSKHIQMGLNFSSFFRCMLSWCNIYLTRWYVVYFAQFIKTCRWKQTSIHCSKSMSCFKM